MYLIFLFCNIPLTIICQPCDKLGLIQLFDGIKEERLALLIMDF